MADTTEHVAQVTRTKGVMQSATLVITGFRARLDEAIAAAIEANDNADLTALTDLSASLEADTAPLAEAIAANP